MKKLISTPVSVLTVPTGSPSRGGDVAVYVFDFVINLPSVFVFMALSTVFHSINSPNDSAFSLFFRSYFCLIGPFNYISFYDCLPQP